MALTHSLASVYFSLVKLLWAQYVSMQPGFLLDSHVALLCVCFKPRWIGCEWGDKNREKHIPVDQTSCAQAFEYQISLSEIAFILSLDRLFPLELSNSTNSKSNYFGKDMWEEFCNMYSRSTFNAFEDFTVHCIPGKWELTGSRCN